MKVCAAIAYNASRCMSATMVISPVLRRIRIEIVGHFVGEQDAPDVRLNEHVLPMQPGQVERRSHDDPRDGTTTPVAGLNSKSGKVISEFHQRNGRDRSANAS